MTSEIISTQAELTNFKAPTTESYRGYVINRIRDRSSPSDPITGCIEYRGTRNQFGYGLISIVTPSKRKMMSAHRALYLAARNCLDLPSSQMILHNCDNPACVNLDHLRAGTAKDNMRDCITRGRRRGPSKPYKKVQKFTDDQIREIRNARGPLRFVAKKHNVSESYVSKLRNSKAKTLVLDSAPDAPD